MIWQKIVEGGKLSKGSSNGNKVHEVIGWLLKEIQSNLGRPKIFDLMQYFFQGNKPSKVIYLPISFYVFFPYDV